VGEGEDTVVVANPDVALDVEEDAELVGAGMKEAGGSDVAMLKSWQSVDTIRSQ
jgi:hypothetical protein